MIFYSHPSQGHLSELRLTVDMSGSQKTAQRFFGFYVN
jgi:hypothetical protein